MIAAPPLERRSDFGRRRVPATPLVGLDERRLRRTGELRPSVSREGSEGLLRIGRFLAKGRVLVAAHGAVI